MVQVFWQDVSWDNGNPSKKIYENFVEKKLWIAGTIHHHQEVCRPR
jgi:hypothetical protein